MLRLLKSKKGTSLIEVLLACAIFSVALVPLLDAFPNGMKMNNKIQKEIDLNQELRSTIIAVNNAIKDSAKELKVAGTSTSKKLINSDGSFASDYFKTSDTSNYKFKVSGTPTVVEGGGVSGALQKYGAKVYFNSGLRDPTDGDIAIELIFLNGNKSAINLQNIKFRYYFTKEKTTALCEQEYFLYYTYLPWYSNFKIDSPKSITWGNGYVEYSFNESRIIDINCCVQMHSVIRAVDNDHDVLNQSDDYSFMVKSFKGTPPSSQYIPAPNYYLWDKVVAYVDGDIEWGAEPSNAGSSSAFKYETVIYNVNVNLYDDKNRIIKSAQIMVNGN